ncbi:hypothetical protein TREMEDRAFT_60437 [Tremella mesenterica DSM 1558]|uniref:uncharacterized protein n=1 Tax=Tremella mesenterica (strain ATCC 24925 / CBS 8224 / DSM 1558 / NBRC 9311 / NRRL Y-6157 / RJB 2259-6 / UBC 559-6) TaxID=578456 RepID=UPI0003F48FF3|nr:uncharacterized protein TREMEDRAFT_60437 [Tremella mesenterica DSM 1558]EIW71512.1 hypothetical protein TREMEDRAFT_60437 [Tremella mesenterica DSM 1558]
MTSYTISQLEKFKVTQLKDTCKSLNIAGYSKLNKTALIERILAANNTDHSDSSSLTPVKKSLSIDSNVSKSTIINDSTASEKTPITATKEKERVTTKRKLNCQLSESSTTSDSQNPAPPCPALVRKTISKELPSIKNSSTTITTHTEHHTTSESNPITHANTSVTKSSSHAAKTTSTVPSEPIQPPIASTDTRASLNKTTSAPVMKKSRPADKTTRKKMPLSKPHFTPISKNVSKIPSRVPFPNFTPLKKIVKSPELPTTNLSTPRNSMSPPALSTEAERRDYMKGHFLNSLFHQLRACRTTPLSTLTDSLEFTGFSRDLYRQTCPEGFLVAIRFYISRLHTALQLGSGQDWSVMGNGHGLFSPDLTTWPTITACESLSADLWWVQVSHSGPAVQRMTRFIVIAITGEPIGQLTKDHKSFNDTWLSEIDLRADWRTFLDLSLNSKAIEKNKHSMIMELVKTKDRTAYPGGISSAWRNRLPMACVTESIRVAERAVLSSCALNSFSGEQRSALEMEAEQQGRIVSGSTHATRGLEIYLPEAGQVLSVHFPPTYHPALAVVHRGSGTSDIVLRETGQVVGDEDCGVASLWQGMLGCDDRGRKDDRISQEFFKNWEKRMSGEDM